MNNKVLSTTPIAVEPLQYRVSGNGQGIEPYTGKTLVRTGVRLTIGMLVVTLSEDGADELRHAIYNARTRYSTTTVPAAGGLPDPDSQAFQDLRIELA